MTFFPTFLLGETQEHGLVISAVAPEYPVRGYMIRASETIQVEILVNGAGTVIEAKALKTRLSDFFEGPCIKAARKWIFAAAEDRSILRKYRITFRFTLMPQNTKDEDLGTIYNSPLEMEVRVRDEPREPLPPTQESTPLNSH